jgi:DMSO/TMAO reductase YedYZ molybdopterin-dependent catalytic subunit
MDDRSFEESHRVIRPWPVNAEIRPEALWQRVTPTGRFFLRCNFPFPADPGRDARLRLAGAVEETTEWSVSELERLPRRTVVVTTECAGNGRTGFSPTPGGEPWRLGGVSTAEWTGVPLAALLQKARLSAGAIEVLARGRDGDPGTDRDSVSDSEGTAFARSIPLRKAMHPDTLVAFAMNDRAIPEEHGAPLRLIVPGWYGMASVKWLSDLEVLTRPFEGYFQHARYRYEYADGTATPVTTMRVRSIITDPVNNGRVPPGRLRVRGWAWSGDGPVTKVEIATGGGDSWHETELGSPDSSHAWTPWHHDWEPDRPGLHVLRSRATDTSGARQPHEAQWNHHGYGNNGINPVFVEVTSADTSGQPFSG